MLEQNLGAAGKEKCPLFSRFTDERENNLVWQDFGRMWVKGIAKYQVWSTAIPDVVPALAMAVWHLEFFVFYKSS